MNTFRAGGSVSWKVIIGPVYEPLFHFVCTRNFISELRDYIV